jgi:hypothetical protein
MGMGVCVCVRVPVCVYTEAHLNFMRHYQCVSNLVPKCSARGGTY